MGKLIVIEGLDGSGKATQAEELVKKLKFENHNVKKVSFPDYDSKGSALVQMYLAGEFGKSPSDVNAYAASAFYAVDRYASWKKDWEEHYQSGGIVLADRYTTSNFIHQGAKLPKGEREEYVGWLQDFEFGRMQLPKPDMVVYLDVLPHVSQGLLNKRYGNDESKKDIHERDLSYLASCREQALWCVKHLGWQMVQCNDGDSMRSISEIATEIYTLLGDVIC